jgi:hypothetical protein
MSGFTGLNTPIATLLTKKMLGVANTNSSLPYNLDIKSIPYINSAQLYSNFIPNTAPPDIIINKTAVTQTIYTSKQYPYIQYVQNLQLTPSPSTSTSIFTVSIGSNNLLSQAIPFNYGDGSYGYKLCPTRNDYRPTTPNQTFNNPIDQKFYMVDPDAGVLYITNGDWVKTNGNPVISFYRYAGPVGFPTNVGTFAGAFSQGTNAIALGNYAGYTGEGTNSIAIGAYAGWSGMAANSTILNASGTGMTTSGPTGGFYVNPIAPSTNSTGPFRLLAYGTDNQVVSITGDNMRNILFGFGTVTGSTGYFTSFGVDSITGGIASFQSITGSTGYIKNFGVDTIMGTTGNFKFLGADVVTGSTGSFKFLGSDVITGSTGSFKYLGSDVVTGSTGNFKFLGADVVTGSTGSFKYLSADVVTGSTGSFKYLGADVVTGSTGSFKFLDTDVVTGSTGSFKYLSADVVTGSTGNFKYLGADVVTGSTGSFKYLSADVVTGSTGNFKYLSADVVTGNTGNFKYLGTDVVTGSTGNFQFLGADVVTGSTGSFKFLGSDVVTGSTGNFKFLGADVVTGSTGNFKYLNADVITGSTGNFQFLGADVVTGSTGNFKFLGTDVVTGSTGNFKFLGSDIVTGSTGNFKFLGADVVTGSTGSFKYLGADVITGSTGSFKFLGADVVTGSTGNFKYLNADIITGSTGSFKFLDAEVVTGSTGNFKFLGTDVVTGSTGNFKYLGADIVTGSTGSFKYLDADVVTGSTGSFKFLGADVVTGSTGNFKYLGADVVTGSTGSFKYLGADVVTGSIGNFVSLRSDDVETTNLIFSDGSNMNTANSQNYDYNMIFKNVSPITSVATSTFSALSSNGQCQLLANTTGFSYSKDFGASWTQQNVSLLPDTTGKFLNIAMSADGSVIVYTIYENYVGPGQIGKRDIIFKALNTSTNGIINKILINADETVQGISISGTGKYISIVTTANMYVSSTYGASWKSPFRTIFIGTSMSLSGKYQLAITGNSIYISKDYGASFEEFTLNLSQGYEYTQCLMSASGKYQIIVATKSGSVNNIYNSSNYGENWSNPKVFNVGGALCTDFSGKILLGKNKSISTDYGATWSTGSTPDLTSIAISGSGQYQLFTTAAGNFIGAIPLTTLIASKIGLNAGATGQGANAIAIGTNAGQYNQGTGSIAIGYLAGPTGMTANSIALNASGTALYGTGPTGGFYVAPIASYKNASNPTGPFHLLAYGPDNQIVTVTGATGLNLSLSTPTVTYDSWLLANIIGAPPAVESLDIDNFTTTDVYITFSYPSQTYSGLSQSGLLPYINNMFVNLYKEGDAIKNLNGVTGSTGLQSNTSDFIAQKTPVEPANVVQCINVTKSASKQSGLGTYTTKKTSKTLKSYTIPYTSLTHEQLATFYIWYSNNNPTKNMSSIQFTYKGPQNPTQVTGLTITPSETSQLITITFTGSDMIDSGDPLSTASINYAISYNSIDGSNTFRYGGTKLSGVVNGTTIGPIGATGGAQSQPNTAFIYPDTAYYVTVNASNTTLGAGSYIGTTGTSIQTTGPAAPAAQTSSSASLSTNVLSAKSVSSGLTVSNLLKTTTRDLPSLKKTFNIHNSYESRGYTGPNPLVNFTTNLSGPVGIIGPSTLIYGFSESYNYPSSSQNGIDLSFTSPVDIGSETNGTNGYYLKTDATMSITNASNIVASSNQYTMCVTGTYSSGNGAPASAATTFYYDGETSTNGTPSISSQPAISITSAVTGAVCGIHVVTSISFDINTTNISGIGQYFYNKDKIISYVPSGPAELTFTPTSETNLLKLTSGTEENGFKTPISFGNTISLSASSKYYAGPVGVSVTPYNIAGTAGSAVSSNTFPLIFDPVSVASFRTVPLKITQNNNDVSGTRVAPPPADKYTIGNESAANPNNTVNNLTNGGSSFSSTPFVNTNSLLVSPYNYELLYTNGNYTTMPETMNKYSDYLYNTLDYTTMPYLNGYRYATFAWKLEPNPINFSKVTVRLTGLNTTNLTNTSGTSGIIGYDNTPIILYCRLEDATSSPISNTLSAINTPWINCNGSGTTINGSNNTQNNYSFTGVTLNSGANNSNSISGSTATFVTTLYTINNTSFPSTSNVYLYCRIGLPASAYFSDITANLSS